MGYFPVTQTEVVAAIDFFDAIKSKVKKNVQRKLMALKRLGLSPEVFDIDGYGALHVCIYEGAFRVFDFLVKEENFSIDARDHLGNTPLHLATRMSNLGAAEFLISRDHPVNVYNHANHSPLHYSVSSGNVFLFDLLISRGAVVDQSIKSFSGFPIHYAFLSYRLNLAIVRDLLQRFNMVNERIMGISPLSSAVHVGDAGLVRLFLEFGAEPSEENPINPLSLACDVNDEMKSLELVKILIEAGANPNFTDPIGRKPIHLAVYNGNASVVSYLSSFTEGLYDLDEMFDASLSSHLHSLVESANEFIDGDEFEKAGSVLREALFLFKSVDGGPSPGQVLSRFCDLLILMNEPEFAYTEASILLDSIANLNSPEESDSSSDVAALHFCMGKASQQLRNFEDAITHFQAAAEFGLEKYKVGLSNFQVAVLNDSYFKSVEDIQSSGRNDL